MLPRRGGGAYLRLHLVVASFHRVFAILSSRPNKPVTTTYITNGRITNSMNILHRDKGLKGSEILISG